MEMAEILKHMMEPRNYGIIEDRDCEGLGENPQNGEKVVLYAKIEDERIVDIKFQAIGCTSTIVAGSIFTDSVKGELINEADILADKILDMLKDKPSEEAACSEMVVMAYKSMYQNYKDRLSDKNAPVISQSISYSCQIEEEKK
ncbi:Iron-sulfur cluster assembly scaffold protein IscU/NifU-like [hydrothermal vent metagenome]|uniref:Iron-sulfur cluster assembly scaffold protein IscU/NifU-like n=1 Tax=hydrothermal vent metagenome TaxID=652676 RepID=A0A1W1EI79_9ZZZZ